MYRKAQLIGLLFAWFIATGSQWDLVQVFGWGRMFASYARVMPLDAAIRLTFAPNNLCDVCKLVKEAKQHEASLPEAPGKAFGKVLLVFMPASPRVFAPVRSTVAQLSGDNPMPGIGRAAPPTPPPQFFAV